MSDRPLFCPDCGLPMSPASSPLCPRCRLPLDGPCAAELRQVESALAALELQRGRLLQRRAVLLAGLRARRAESQWTDAAARGWAPAPVRAPRQDAAPPSVQTVLLVLGGLLVTVSGLVFTLVNWGHLGIGGRAAVLAVLTVLALSVPVPLRRRRLVATAEAASAVGLALALLDCYAARATGLAGLERVDTAAYWAAATALTAVGAAVYGWGTRSAVMPSAALLLLQATAPLAAAAAGADSTGWATALVATAWLDLAAATVLRAPLARRGSERSGAAPARLGRITGAVAAVLSGVCAATAALTAHDYGSILRACGPLALVVLLCAVAARRRDLPYGVRLGTGALAGFALVTAAAAAPRLALPGSWAVLAHALPATLVATAALARFTGAAAGSRSRPLWTGLAASGALVLAAAVAEVLPALVDALTEPPRRGLPGGDAGAAPFPEGWTVAPVVPAVAALAAVALNAAAALIRAPKDRDSDREGRQGPASIVRVRLPAELRSLLGCAAVLASVAAVALVPVAAGWSYAAALAAAWFPALLPAVHLVRRPGAHLAVRVCALLAPVALALVWSLPETTATLTVWGATALLAAGLAAALHRSSPGWLPAGAAALAVGALGVEAARTGAAAGLPPHLAAFAVLGVGVATVPVAAVLRGTAAARTGHTRVAAAAMPGPTDRPRRTETATAPPDLHTGMPPTGAGRSTATPGQPAYAMAAAAPPRVNPTTAPAAPEPHPGAGVEWAGYAVAVAALLMAASHPGSLSVALAVAGVVALGVALRADRRAAAALAGTSLLTASSWVRLAMAGVDDPEFYTVTISAVALVLGRLRRRRAPGTGSWPAYGAALCVTLVPSLGAAWSDTHWLRPLLLGLAALGVTLLGARHRLRAPLLIGGAILVADALHELAPTIAQALGLLPRWAPLTGAGLLLLFAGATYEHRLTNARRLGDRLRRMD
jgi:hypothetical protein